ncbi:hypothetical protein J3459_015791 [Metarhizium acridum]|nr:hypothetical protein J3459_015791 [Metarhizium acridum]
MKAFTDELFSGATVSYGERGHPRGDAWLLKLWNWGRLDISTVDAFAKGLATSIGATWRRNPKSLGIDPWRGDWKSSILPYLFQNMTLPSLTDRETESDLKKAAEGVGATFEPVDGRWEFDYEQGNNGMSDALRRRALIVFGSIERRVLESRENGELRMTNHAEIVEG